MSRLDRRAFMTRGLFAAAGAGTALLVPEVVSAIGPDRLPLAGGYAPADDHLQIIRGGQVGVVWYVPTTEPVFALAFDDGPQPDWTPMVLDQLDEVDAPATFFMIGKHLRDNKALVVDRMDRHEIGNHTWTHPDLATLDVDQILDELSRTHDEIVSVFGRAPTIMRPPYGHVGGAMLLGASHMNYDVILWNVQMHPENYGTDTAAQVAAIIQASGAGSIVLVHDVGDPNRLPGLRGVADIVRGMRAKGLQPVTVSQMLALPRSTVATQAP